MDEALRDGEYAAASRAADTANDDEQLRAACAALARVEQRCGAAGETREGGAASCRYTDPT